MRSGLIEDPYFDRNEPKLLWIGETDWQYSATFDADPELFDHERIDLVCDGLDTIATIVLNGSHVASTKNMHRAYRFDVRPYLKKGRNELTVTFASPVHYAHKMRQKLGHLPSINYGIPFNFIRKMACNFGWDWGPVVPTCGMWKGVRLEGWSECRINRVWLDGAEMAAGHAGFRLRIAIDRTSQAVDPEVFFNISEPGTDRGLPTVGNINDEGGNFLAFVGVGRPELWWPIGYGQQPLYTIQAGLHDIKKREFYHTVTLRTGLRTVELDTHPDDIGRSFVLKVNGKPIFCKGFNWIPDDCFLDRACTPERYRRRIQQALNANANMLRVWGGGIYETDAFYDICDEMGMLVWQDFLFVCAAYPEDEETKAEVEAEARHNVARLAHHPSLVLWNGCNENIWGYHEWACDAEGGGEKPWRDQLAGKKWGAGYYLDLLPRVMKEVDPSRPFWAASPWSGDPNVETGLHPNLATHGNKHIWEVWHGPGDYNNYRWFTPRFCSEFGYQGPPNYSTLASAIAKDQLYHGSPALEMHQKSPYGTKRNDDLVSRDFDLPENFDDRHYLLQLNQARALKTGVEWFRSRQPVCMGTLYWQLNDCYPVVSWSAIDSNGLLKPLWYATRRFYAPRLLTLQPEGTITDPPKAEGGRPTTRFDAMVLFANNDSDEPWRGEVLVRRLDFDGNELGKTVVPIDVAPRSNLRAAVLPVGVVSPRNRSREFIVATFEDLQATWFFASDRDLAYPAPKFESTLESSTFGEHRLTIRAHVLLREIVINIDRLDPSATISDNVVTILPGKLFTFVIHSERLLTPEQLISPPVFQCANRFGKLT
jgi:beta-mannosidase